MTEDKLVQHMQEWLTGCFEFVQDDEAPQRRLLIHILKGQHLMALNVKVLNDAVAALGTNLTTLDSDVKQLIALHTDPAAQAAVDAAATAIVNVDASVKALTAAITAITNPPATPPAA